MRDPNENWFYLPAGAVAAILLGMILVPLREHTHAGNFIFAFVILIVVIAEMGGRWAAIATAACSALSLDFFLTRPYLRLSIEGKHDLIAFAGLAVCGVVAAAIGTRRVERIMALDEARSHLRLLHEAFEAAAASGTTAARIEAVLRATREALPLSGVVVRDATGTVVAATSPPHAARPEPGTVLDGDSFLPPGLPIRDQPRGGTPLPAEGGRLPLQAGDRPIGWVDIWGDGRPAGLEDRRTLSGVIRLLAVMLDR